MHPIIWITVLSWKAFIIVTEYKQVGGGNGKIKKTRKENGKAQFILLNHCEIQPEQPYYLMLKRWKTTIRNITFSDVAKKHWCLRCFQEKKLLVLPFLSCKQNFWPSQMQNTISIPYSIYQKILDYLFYWLRAFLLLLQMV